MNEKVKDIKRYVSEWILGRLSERIKLKIPNIGTFFTSIDKEYALRSNEGELTLFPPAIQLRFEADDYLLNARNYLTYDITYPEKLTSKGMIEAISGLYGISEKEVRDAFEDYLREFFTQLFRGRRVSFLGLGDFYASEESEGLLVLSFESSERVVHHLNHPFDSYHPIRLPEEIPPSTLLNIRDTAPTKEFPKFPIVDTLSVEDLFQDSPNIAQSGTLLVDSSKSHSASIESLNSSTLSLDIDDIQVSVPCSDVSLESKTQLDAKVSNHGFDIGTRKGLILTFSVAVIVIVALLLGIVKSRIANDTVSNQHLIDEQSIVSDTVLSSTLSADTKMMGNESLGVVLPLDTIQSGETLVKLARRYYGITDYWVYLYIQNIDKIEDPNNVSIGTIIEVPDLKQFHLKEDPKASIIEAKDLAFVILNGKFSNYEAQRLALPSNSGVSRIE